MQKFLLKYTPEQRKEYQKKRYQKHKEWNTKYAKEHREQKKKWRICHREQCKGYCKKYHDKPEVKEHQKEYAKGRKKQQKMADRKWKQNHKEQIKKYLYDNKLHINAYQREWKKTERGKALNRKQSSRNRRNKDWIEILPNIFPEDISIEYHHIDGKIFIVPIPKIIHRRYQARPDKIKHIEQVNEWIEFYYVINPTDILKEMNL